MPIMYRLYRLIPGIPSLLAAAALLPCPEPSNAQIPGRISPIEGRETVKELRLMPDGRVVTAGKETHADRTVFQIPAAKWRKQSKLLGMVDFDGDGRDEVFLGWVTPSADRRDEWMHHFQVFRREGENQAELPSEFTLPGAVAKLLIIRPRGARDSCVVIIDIFGGATWSTAYLLRPDTRSPEKLFSPNDHEFMSLNRDEDHVLVAWDRRMFDPSCPRWNDFLVGHANPEIYLRSAATYRKIWPPADWALSTQQGHSPRGTPYQIMAALDDLDGDNTIEMVALTSQTAANPGPRSLEVYRLEHESFLLVAKTVLPSAQVAHFLSIRNVRGKQIVVRLADRAQCSPPTGGTYVDDNSGFSEAVYTFRAGQLHLLSTRKTSRPQIP